MLRDELPDDLVAFLQTDRRLRYDVQECEIGVFTLRALDEVQEIALAVSAEAGDAVAVLRGLDLLESCEEYDPRGMLVYIPSLRKYGSYDCEKQSLVTYRGMSWSNFLANPTRYINAAWFEDKEIAEETFNESDANRIVEACSAANATEAGFLCSVLEEAGIRADVAGATLGTVAGLLPMGEATAPRIWVREGDSGRAREIVNEVNNRRREPGPLSVRDDDDVEFPCQECGIMLTFPATLRGAVETCPACGNYVDVPEDRQDSMLSQAKNADTKVVKRAPAENLLLAALAERQAVPKKRLPSETLGSENRTNTQLWLEVVAVLFLAYVPYLVSALADISGSRAPRQPHPVPYHLLLLLIDSLQTSLPVLVIIALSREPWRSFGIVRPKWFLDVAGAFAISLATAAAYRIVLGILPPAILHSLTSAPPGHSAYSAGTHGVASVVLLVVTQGTVGFAEELVMRAYLITRFERLMSSTWLAVVVTTAMFASYHAYQGVLGTISAAVVGLVNAVAFCWFRRLWPLCLAHAAHNIWIGLG